jgi:hypothetical protein
MYKLTVYVPDSHLEPLKQALFAAGAGRLGDYAQCCWQVKGIGQFCALAGATPFIGQINQLEQVEEWRVEMLLSESCRDTVVQALRKSHPYQTPAFDLIKVDV